MSQGEQGEQGEQGPGGLPARLDASQRLFSLPRGHDDAVGAQDLLHEGGGEEGGEGRGGGRGGAPCGRRRWSSGGQAPGRW